MIKLIYVENEIRNHPRVLSICARLPMAKVVECDHYGEIFNRNNQSFRIQKENACLILGTKKNKRILPVPQGLAYQKPSYYFSHMLNCVYDCRYCFLQGMFRSAHYLLFINYEDFVKDIKKMCQQSKTQISFFSGYDCDSLALDPLTHFSNIFVPLFKNIKNSKLELRTKSTQIRSLLEMTPSPNVICSYTLNPEEIVSKFEHKTPTLKSRVKAIQKLAAAGWSIGLRFDPLILTNNFKQVYSVFFDELFSSIDTAKVDSITVGTFRLSADQYKRMVRSYPQEWLYQTISRTSPQRVGYPTEVEDSAIDWCIAELNRFAGGVPIFFQSV